MNTRDRILREALRLFSEKGFEAVSVRNIAGAVGIKESSLYNHFTGKQDIFDSIISEYNARGEAFFSKMDLTGEDMQFSVDEKTINTYKNMPPEQFVLITGSIFDFYFTDEINVQMRKMLTMEQYRNEKIAKMYREISFEGALDYQSRLFEALIAAGCFIDVDPYIMALEFFAPIFLIFYKFDNDKQSLSEAKDLFQRHIAQFVNIYAIKKEEGK